MARLADPRKNVDVTDPLTPEQRHRRMASVRRTGSEPERRVRRLLRDLGIRFRTNVKRLPGSPDIVVPHLHWILFVHGCFWHGHHCHHGRAKARTHAAFWENKIATNTLRDRRVVRRLRLLGWKVTVVWQCQLRATDRITNRLRRIAQAQAASESQPTPRRNPAPPKGNPRSSTTKPRTPKACHTPARRRRVDGPDAPVTRR